MTTVPDRAFFAGRPFPGGLPVPHLTDLIPMHRACFVLFLAGAMALHASPARAQSSGNAPMLSRGDRVRVTLSAEETRRTGRGLVSGRLVSGDSAYVVIMRGDAARADTIPTFTIDEVELYTGQRSRSRMIIVGTALGVAASGMVWGYDRLSRDSRCGRMNECPPLLPSGYYAIPIAAGAVSGATFSASRWISVPRRAIYIGFAASRAVQLSAAMQFR